MSRRLAALIVANVLIAAALVVGTIAVNRRLDRQIAAKERTYQVCVARTKPKLVPKKCGWKSLSQRQDAALYGDIFAVLALGLTDFLLWSVRPLRT